MSVANDVVENKRRLVEDLKFKNQNNVKGIAGEYFGNKFTYQQTFQMIESQGV